MFDRMELPSAGMPVSAALGMTTRWAYATMCKRPGWAQGSLGKWRAIALSIERRRSRGGGGGSFSAIRSIQARF